MKAADTNWADRVSALLSQVSGLEQTAADAEHARAQQETLVADAKAAISAAEASVAKAKMETKAACGSGFAAAQAVASPAAAPASTAGLFSFDEVSSIINNVLNAIRGQLNHGTTYTSDQIDKVLRCKLI